MRIMLVEDDQKAARLLRRGLQEEGFTVDHAASAEEADALLAEAEHDLVVLDWMLPGCSGAEWCGELRRRGSRLPVLMLTARDALADRVAGLNIGADDYLTKPFAFEELLARVRSLLRRAELGPPSVLVVGDLQLDPAAQQASRAGQVLDLTRKEFRILELLMRRAGQVASRALLAEQIWRTDLIAIDNLMDVHISNLRRKLDVPAGAAPMLHTLRGRGFWLGPLKSGDA